MCFTASDLIEFGFLFAAVSKELLSSGMLLQFCKTMISSIKKFETDHL